MKLFIIGVFIVSVVILFCYVATKAFNMVKEDLDNTSKH